MDEDGVPYWLRTESLGDRTRSEAWVLIKVTWRRGRLTNRDSEEDWSRIVILYWIYTGNTLKGRRVFQRLVSQIGRNHEG